MTMQSTLMISATIPIAMDIELSFFSLLWGD
jgi:hypothetical protein